MSLPGSRKAARPTGRKALHDQWPGYDSLNMGLLVPGVRAIALVQ